MNDLDLIDSLNKSTIEQRRLIYSRLFTIGTNTTSSFKDKVELITLLCFLFQKMTLKDPVKFNNTLSVLNTILNRNIEQDEDNITTRFLIGLSIVCDDFLYGSSESIVLDKQYTSAKEIVNRIKSLLDEWVPF